MNYKQLHVDLLKTLSYTSSLFKKHNLPFWLSFGTLLGAVRNGKIIPWDEDIDLGIWDKDFPEISLLKDEVLGDGFGFTTSVWNLENPGSAHFAAFKLRSAAVGIRKEYIHPIPVSVQVYCSPQSIPGTAHADLFLFGMQDDKSYCVEYPKFIWPTKDLQVLGEIEFQGKMFPCPQFPENGIISHYGQDWRVPKVMARQIDCLTEDAEANKDILDMIKNYEIYVCNG